MQPKIIENIVVGVPIAPLHELLASDESEDFMSVTAFTQERFLPKILKDLGLVQSTSWVRKNRPDLFIELNEITCMTIQISKKSKPIFVVIGE